MIYIYTDEAYSDFVPEHKTFHSLGKFSKYGKYNTVNAISKNYGISGWRLGYVITNEALINQILKNKPTYNYVSFYYFRVLHCETFDEIIELTCLR